MKVNWLHIFLTTAIAAIAILLFVEHLNRPKLGYIIISEVYSKFELKKQLEHKFLSAKANRQKVLDSLGFDLRLLAKRIDAAKGKDRKDEDFYNSKREEFYRRTQMMEEDNNALSKQYDTEIFNQLNQYVRDYGKEFHYQFIFGNDGNGSLMHGEDDLNVTDDVVKYINRKYSGR